MVLVSTAILLATFALTLFAKRLRTLTIVGLFLALVTLPFFPTGSLPLIRQDQLGTFFTLIFLVVALVVALASKENTLAYYGSLLLSTIGMILAASTADLFLLYVAIELVTTPSYVLVAYARKRERMEAGVKYFIVSIVASALLLLGVLLLAVTGGTSAILGLQPDFSGLFFLGVGAFLAGLGFKLGIFPFNLWIPDVYQGSRGEIAGLLAAASKKAAFAALLPVAAVLVAFVGSWTMLIAVLAALTMTIPNLIALVQEDARRMLAYSIMTHAGFLLMGVAAVGVAGFSGTLFHAFTHAFMALGAFLVVGIFARRGFTKIEQYRGAGYRNPLLGISLTIFLLSLAGIPLLAGFASKLYLFTVIVLEGMTWLTVLAILNSAIALYYYFRVIRALYGYRAAGKRFRIRRRVMLAMAICLFATIFVGLYPVPIIEFAVDAAGSLF